MWEVGKTRVLNKRARYKYPLGYYIYGGKENRVLFECSRLVGIDCHSEDDLETGKFNDDSVRLLVLKPKIVGILIHMGDERGDSNFEILKKYCVRGDKLDRIKNSDLGIEFKDNGVVRIGEKAKRG